MDVRVEPSDPGKQWRIVADAETELGIVDRFATGYMVTLAGSGRKIKRFRMIDALREALGNEAKISIVDPPPNPPIAQS